MSHTIDELTEQIAALNPSEQEELWERVAEMNFQRGMEALSQKYRARLATQGKLGQHAEKVMGELAQIRAEIAADEYRR